MNGRSLVTRLARLESQMVPRRKPRILHRYKAQVANDSRSRRRRDSMRAGPCSRCGSFGRRIGVRLSIPHRRSNESDGKWRFGD
jgi:hypothetical protein